MIKLTLNPHHEAKIFRFSKSEIILGSSKDADLNLPGEMLEPVHLIIQKQETGNYLVINQANDPFVSLNSLPFGKKNLKDSDLILIGKTEILFNEENEQGFEVLSEESDPLSRILEKALRQKDTAQSYASPYTPFYQLSFKQLKKEDEEGKEFEVFNENRPAGEQNSLRFEMEDLDIEALVREVENFEKEEQVASQETPREISSDEEKLEEIIEEEAPQPIEEKLPPISKQGVSLKEYYLGEFDDENENWKRDEDKALEQNLSQKSIPIWNQKIFRIILLFLILIGSLGGIFWYLNVSGKSEEEEFRAAEEVADVAMALLYAQINHIKPHHQNWSNSDFIKNSLAGVVMHENPALANIDHTGKSGDSPYILRIYTSSDFSNFVVIAQAAPSLLHWLIPRTSIIVDSQGMEIRKVADLKALNRLLVNSEILEGPNAAEVFNLIRQGELIPLSEIDKRNDNKEFTPPKALSLFRPGAENLIYNAPRYYRVGETIMKRAVNLMDNQGNHHEISRLKQEMGVISSKPNMVLYSSLGMQFAMQAQQSISTFASQAKFLTAYLTFNTKGVMIGSRLVMDEEKDKHSNSLFGSLPTINESSDALAFSTEAFYPINIEEGMEQHSSEEIDPNHPLLLQLLALANQRKQALRPLSDEMIAILNRNLQEINPRFIGQFSHLVNEYEKMDEEQQGKLSALIKQKAKEYHDMPPTLFRSYVRSAGLEELLNAQFHNEGGDKEDLIGNSYPYQYKDLYSFEFDIYSQKIGKQNDRQRKE